MPKCTGGQAENPARAKFCLECGAPLAAQCAGCGTDLPPAAKFDQPISLPPNRP
jgi:hypothetical protein